MPLALSANQKFQYNSQGWFIGKQLISSDLAQEILEAIRGKKGEKWRLIEPLRSLVTKVDFARIYSQLLGISFLQIAHAALLTLPIEKEGKSSLSELIPIDPLLGGILIQLSPALLEEEIFLEEGDALFLSAKLPLASCPVFQSPLRTENEVDFPSSSHLKYLLITYAGARARVIHRPKAHWGGELKAMGYASGDRLQEVTHPILVRRSPFWL